MKSKKIRSIIFLFITALIWGVAFVAQKSGSETVGPYCFTFLRSYIAVIVLIPTIYLFGRKNKQLNTKKQENKKMLIISGLICGTFIFVATTLQQIGLTEGADAGKSGFITALYIVLVPLIGIFLRKKIDLKVWISVAIALIGLYLLCFTRNGSISKGDLLVAICALIFSFHIHFIDYFSGIVDCIKLSCVQFFVCGTFSLIMMLITNESNTLSAVLNAYIPLLYLGVLSSGVAYTLQIIAQKDTDPTIASLIMSLESVFAVLAGLLFGERLLFREICGCIVMFTAIILSQLPTSLFKKSKTN